MATSQIRQSLILRIIEDHTTITIEDMIKIIDTILRRTKVTQFSTFTNFLFLFQVYLISKKL